MRAPTLRTARASLGPIPRQLSVHSGSDWNSILAVYLDGRLVHKVVAFDRDAGWVEHMAVDSEGKIIHVHGEIVMEHSVGHVQLADVRRVKSETIRARA